MNLRRPTTFELFLIQVVLYALIWLISDYAGSFLSAVFACIFLAIFIISLLVEAIERSKVPRWYYWAMVVSFLAPTIVGLFFLLLGKGELSWLR